MGNDLRMSFAEWLYRMSEADVPYQARGLATYAVLFKITANDELAKLSGMDMKGLADKTYNKWKKFLSDNGWVIIKAVTVGRTTTIEVYPAVGTSPVTFTDVKPRDPGRFALGKSYETREQVTGESYSPDVKNTDEAVKVTADESQNYEPEVKITEASRAPTCAHLETPSGLVIPKKLLDNPPLPPKTEPATDAQEPQKSEEIPPLNAYGEEEKVAFVGGELRLFNGYRAKWLKMFDDDDVKLDLAVAQAAGYVQPNNRVKPLEAQVSAQLARMVRDKKDKDERYAKAAKSNAKTGSKPEDSSESKSDRWSRMAEEPGR